MCLERAYLLTSLTQTRMAFLGHLVVKENSSEFFFLDADWGRSGFFIVDMERSEFVMSNARGDGV